MGRYRSRSRSYSPAQQSRSPPRKRRYEDSRESSRGSRSSYRDRRSSGPSGLLIRNICLDARPEDLRTPFERFGPVKDVYLPKNYYTGEPRGFGFVKFRNADDAAEAKHQMNHQVIGGREITIVYAEENRKTPQEMRKTTRVSSRSGGSSRRRSPGRSPRRRHRSYSRSPSPAGRGSRSPSPARRDSRSPSPVRRDSRDRARGSKDYSPRRSVSRSPPPPRDERRHRSEGRERTPIEKNHKSVERSPSPRANGHSPSRSRSYSPKR